MSLLGAGSVVASSGVAAPSLLANGTTGSASSNTFSSLPGVSAPAGKVVFAAILTQGTFVSSLTDSVDPGTPWTVVAAGGPGSMDMRLFRRIVPAGGFDSLTTFTVTWGATATSSAFLVGSVPGATSVSGTTNDGASPDASGVTSITASVAGTTMAPSWQVAAVGTSWATGTAGPDPSSDPSWIPLGNNSNGNVWGIAAYYRQASTTSGTTLIVNSAGTSNMSAVWGEAKP